MFSKIAILIVGNENGGAQAKIASRPALIAEFLTDVG
jgi:hypothetical protein